ncbi:hypothetical protein ACNOYE_10665 [Nannocystaceae bacterium ST9]
MSDKLAPTTTDALARKARELLPILRRQARRPYIVELAGTPKAGKTTTLHVLNRFLKDCGYQVHEMRERASDCPIAMKGHFFFNTWTTTTMLASMIESLESEADVLLLDRGIFDAIVWLEYQSLDHQVSREEREVFRNFVLLERWRQLTDLTFVLTVQPEIALVRENKDLLIPRTGSIMSPASLSRYNDVLRSVQKAEGDRFNFIEIDTTKHQSPQATTLSIVTELVDRMDKWADPEIAVLPKSFVEDMLGSEGIQPIPSPPAQLESNIQFRKRSTLEESDEFVGLVGAVVLRYNNQMLLLRRMAERDEKRMTFGRDVLWKGCHIARTSAGISGLLTTISTAVKARLREDFHLGRLESEPTPQFLVWNRHDPRDARHLGVFFDLEIPSEEIAKSLASKVFKRERNRTKLGRNEFITRTDLQARVDENDDIELESWSLQYLKKAEG